MATFFRVALIACLIPLCLPAQKMPDAADADEDFTFIPSQGIFPGIDLFGLLGGSINPYVLFIDQLVAPLPSYALVSANVVPFSFKTISWLHYPDGREIDPLGPDFAKASWRQFSANLNILAYQGLLPEQPNNPWFSPLAVFAGYRGFYVWNYQSVNPEAFIFQSDRPDKFQYLCNEVVLGLKLYAVDSNRLLNTLRGISGQVQLEWAPRQLANDILGLSDFTRLSGNLSFNLPLIEQRDVSLYLFQKTAFDLAWFPAQAMPFSLNYLTGLAGSDPVRGAFVPDACMHLASNFDLRLSFPSLVDTTLMPGLVLFWDCAWYDRYDYRLAGDRFRTSIGIDLMAHLDMSVLFPSQGFIDVQLGLAWELTRNQPSLHFSTELPL